MNTLLNDKNVEAVTALVNHPDAKSFYQSVNTQYGRNVAIRELALKYKTTKSAARCASYYW